MSEFLATGRGSTVYEVLLIAEKHGGRYLIPHFCREQEQLCQRVVDARLAKWIPTTSSFCPGIELLP